MKKFQDFIGTSVIFEGTEGSGKTTAVKYVHDELVKKDKPVFMFKEPGGTYFGQELRKLIIADHLEHEILDPTARMLMFYASRIQNLKINIIPHLEKGHIVLLDRYFYSTHVKQGFIDGNFDMINGVERSYENKLLRSHPDFLVYMNVSLETSLKRTQLPERQDQITFFENQGKAWRQKDIEGYGKVIKMAKEDGANVLEIDANKELDVVKNSLDTLVEQLCNHN